VNSCEHTEMT